MVMRDGVRLPASCTNRESISLNSFQVLALEDIGCGLRLFTQIQNRILRERYCQYLPCPPSSVPQIPMAVGAQAQAQLSPKPTPIWVVIGVSYGQPGL